MGRLGIRQQPQYGMGRNRFAATAFTHQSHGFAAVNIKRYLLDGVDDTFSPLEVDR
jgi:hypothetical protein